MIIIFCKKMVKTVFRSVGRDFNYPKFDHPKRNYVILNRPPTEKPPAALWLQFGVATQRR